MLNGEGLPKVIFLSQSSNVKNAMSCLVCRTVDLSIYGLQIIVLKRKNHKSASIHEKRLRVCQ